MSCGCGPPQSRPQLPAARDDIETAAAEPPYGLVPLRRNEAQRSPAPATGCCEQERPLSPFPLSPFPHHTEAPAAHCVCGCAMERQWRAGVSDHQTRRPQTFTARRVKFARAVIPIGGRSSGTVNATVDDGVTARAASSGNKHRCQERGAVRDAGVVVGRGKQWRSPNSCLPSPLT
jgi:hypothetical protein